MALSTRVNATNATIWSLDGTSYFADLINCTITFNNKTEDIAGAGDTWEYNAITKHGLTGEASFFANSGTPSFYAAFSSGTARGLLSYNPGATGAGGTVTGTVTITSCGIAYERDTYTKINLSFSGYGTPTAP